MHRTFQIASIKDIKKQMPLRINEEIVGQKLQLLMPEVNYGDKIDNFLNSIQSNNRYNQTAIELLPPMLYTLDDCTVWSTYGLVFIDNFLVGESLLYSLFI
jgi:hypothetical protein